MKKEILIYTPRISARLTYVLDYIFTERLSISYRTTNDAGEYRSFRGPKLNYSANDPGGGNELDIRPHSILFEENIREQEMHINRWKHSYILFYNQPRGIISFDLFAAVFYMISRYEEYLPFTPDAHGRFPAVASLAVKFSFLQSPVVDEWIFHLRLLLQQRFNMSVPVAPFESQLSFDVDMIWKYRHKHKPLLLAGMLKDIVKLSKKGWQERQQVINHNAPDPFDCFEYIFEQTAQLRSRPLCFILVNSKQSGFDRNTPPGHPAFREKVKYLSRYCEMGIHPSYYANERSLIASEKNTLFHIVEQPVTRSRQHFIKLQLPGTYRQLLQAGAEHDYTMGFPEMNGFRAGTGRSFLWFDLLKNETATLRVHPFVFMDATSVFYRKQTADEAYAEWERLLRAAVAADSKFTSIWHNYLIGDALCYPSQKRLFSKCLNSLLPYQ